MGSLFESKTKSTSTSSTKVPQNYQNFINMSLGRAEAAGTQGFNQYNAPRIAELSGNEQAGINAAGSQAGMYQPVVNMAMQASADMLGNATPDASQYINPYVNYVLGNSLDRLQEQSDTNMTKIGSSAAMSGAFGGLRHGVLEGANLSELLKSARDLSGTTYSDAYDKGLNTWFRAQDNQRANVGSAIQNVRGAQDYNTQDMQRLMSTGLTERTRNQAGLDFGYSEFMREDQDDLNKASFLSTIASQYPRDLFTKTNTTETTQSDSPIKTLAGIGLAAAGIMSGNPAALAGLGAGQQATSAPTNILPMTQSMPSQPVSYGYESPFGNDSRGRIYNKGGLVKKYANGGMVKAGLGMMAGMDPLEAVTEHLKQAKEDNTDFSLGGFLAGGWLLGEAEDRMKRRKPVQEPEMKYAPIPKRAPFNLEDFMRNLNFSSFTRPSQNTVNPSYGAPSSMPQFNQTYTPMSQQRVPLAPGIPGPGGPQGLQGQTLQRPVAQDPVNQPLSVYAKGGTVKKDPFDAISPEALKEVADSWTLGNTTYYPHTAPNREEYLRRLEANKQYAQRRLGQYELGDLRNFSGWTAADGNASQEEYIRRALMYQNRINAESAPGPKNSMAMIRDGAREDFAGPADGQRRDALLSDALSSLDAEDLKKYLDHIGKKGSSTDGLWEALDGTGFTSDKYIYFGGRPQEIIPMLTRWKEKDRQYTNPSKYADGGFVSPQRKDPTKSVPMLDPKTLDILGEMLAKQGPENQKVRQQYEQHQFGNAGNPNPPMPDWMQDPEMIRMMQETFGNSSVPQFDSFQDVIDGKQSGYAKGGDVGIDEIDSTTLRKTATTNRKEVLRDLERVFLEKAARAGGGGRTGPNKLELAIPAPDEGHYDIMRMLGSPRKKRPYLGMQSVMRNEYPRAGDTLGDLSAIQAELGLMKNEAKQRDYVTQMPLVKQNNALENRLNTVGTSTKGNNPLDDLVASIKNQMIARPAPMLHDIVGDTNHELGMDGIYEVNAPLREPPIFDDTWEDRARFLNNIDPSKSLQGEYKPFTPTKKRSPLEFEPLDPNLPANVREKEEAARKLILENAKKKKYAHGGKVMKFQEGGPAFVEGGKSFSKSQDRVPAEMVDPLAALYHGMDSSAGKFQPDFKNLGREDILGSVGEGTITKAQARNQGKVPQFDTMREVIDSLPIDPNTETRSFSLKTTPTHTKSRMWDSVNEDLFIEGTKANEQDNRVRNKLLSTNPDTQAFSQYQFTPDTWNGAVAKIDPETRKRLNINPVVRSDIKKYASGDNRLAEVLPSQEAVDYVYKTDYLPEAYSNLKKANLPITELNLYLAHHLGRNGAPKAIPLLYDEKNKDTPMKDILYKAGLKKAATLNGNPWSNDKNPKLTFAQYRKMKEKAYEDLREKYRGQTLEELSAESAKQFGPPRDFDRRTIDGGTTTFNPVKIIGDSYTKGGMGFNKGGQVKKFSKGGGAYSDSQILPLEDWDEVFKRQYGDDSLVLPLQDWDSVMPPPPDVTAEEIDLYRSIPKGNKGDVRDNKVTVMGPGSYTATVPQKQPRGPNVLRMPENPADWKTREPGMLEKARERSKDPKGIGYWDDFLSQIPGLEITPSTSGKVPTDQKIVLPIDEKGWDYKPNPNLYSDPLGEWGNSGDPVDNFYNEMSDMIGQPSGGQPVLDEGASGAPGGPGGAPPAPAEETDPEFEMLRELYANQLREYKDAQTKPKKGAVFGMFDDVNEPLLKLGLSILASKGSFGNALGEAGLASLADRDKEQMKKSTEASEKLQEILKMRYTNAMIESMDPRIKQELARQAQAAKLEERKYQIGFAREQAGITAKETRINEVLKSIMKWQTDNEGTPVPQEWLDIANAAGYKFSNPEDKGTSLFD